jgi:FixJ family two-component response regulator
MGGAAFRAYLYRMADPALLIAIVDDDVEVGKALKRLLSSWGFAAEPFTSGRQFFDWLPGRATICVLLDIQLPGMSGFEIQKKLAREFPGLPCVFITASGDAADPRRAAECGCELLHKPLDEERLLGAIRRATEDRRNGGS